MRSIREDMNSMEFGISCWSLDALRRLSEPTAAQQGVIVPADTMGSAEEDVHIMERTLSETATMFDNEPDLRLRSVPTAISSHSGLSISLSSTSSRGVASTIETALAPADSKVDWDNFHFHVLKCKGNKECIEQIRDILQRHSDGSTLANSTDTWHRNPLHVAAQHGDVDLARVLLTFGADVNAHDSESSSILNMAVEWKRRHFVAFLLDHGANNKALLPRNISAIGEMKRSIRFENIAT